MTPFPLLRACRAAEDLSVQDLDHAAWDTAPAVTLDRYWSGAPAPPRRHAEARLVWTPDALLVRFICAQGEPPVVRDQPDTSRKVMGLWDFDVCEIFVAPEAESPEHYYEFEAAPTGEWLDVEIRWRPDGRDAHWDYQSGMQTAARQAGHQITVALRLPWSAFGHVPHAGARWRVNLFRCVGPSGPERGYLAWQPTRTPQPNFHVPQAFGWLEFAA